MIDIQLVTAMAVRTALVLFALVVGLRVGGRRHIGELNLYDLLLVLLIANAVQNSMTKGSGSLAVSVGSCSVLIVLGWFAGKIESRFPLLERRLMGSPTVLVYNGGFIERNMRREQVDPDAVMMNVRQIGLRSLGDVRLAVLEMDGSISVVPRDKD